MESRVSLGIKDTSKADWGSQNDFIQLGFSQVKYSLEDLILPEVTLFKCRNNWKNEKSLAF